MVRVPHVYFFPDPDLDSKCCKLPTHLPLLRLSLLSLLILSTLFLVRRWRHKILPFHYYVSSPVNYWLCTSNLSHSTPVTVESCLKYRITVTFRLTSFFSPPSDTQICWQIFSPTDTLFILQLSILEITDPF